MKSILYMALITGCFTYLFWEHFPKEFFYIGNALFIFLICTYLFCLDKSIFVKFILFSLSLSNLLDELYFNPEILGLNELALLLTLPFVWFFKYKK